MVKLLARLNGILLSQWPNGLTPGLGFHGVGGNGDFAGVGNTAGEAKGHYAEPAALGWAPGLSSHGVEDRGGLPHCTLAALGLAKNC